MNSVTHRFKKAFVWMARIRKRKGYGVHSPFAYEYIREVIYGKMNRTFARALRMRQRMEAVKMGREWATAEWRSEKELLYRMVRKAQPALIVNAGDPSAASLYITAAQHEAYTLYINEVDELNLDLNTSVDFLYLHRPDDTDFTKAVFDCCADLVGSQSVFAIHGIHHSDKMRALWAEMVADPRSGITFDLYDIGIILFDKKITKQDYIVNF